MTNVPKIRVVQVMPWLFALVIATFAGGAAHAADASVGNCHVGAYRLADGKVVDVGPSEGAHLRWRLENGTTDLLTSQPDGTWTSTLGWTDKPDGIKVAFSDCAKGRIDFAGMHGQRIAFDVTNVRFQGAGVTLAGRLVLPKGHGRVSIVVLVHGSEHMSALDFYSLQRMFPASGIGVFVYDKRGTGASGGAYTQDYLLLADDAIAAVNEAKRLAGARAGRIGYQGGSQGGWVVPLAARISPVDFVIVGFGLAVSPLDEDREAIAYDMQRQGYGPDVMAKAMHVADASAAILLSNFRSGYDKLDAVKQKYGKEPWFKHVHGDITWLLLAWPTEKLKQEGPVLLAGVPAQYDPMPVLRNLDTPQLWILGGEDADAPSAETIKRLRGLQQASRPITLAVYPHAQHGIYQFETKPDGTRVDTRNPDGYFAMMRDFILSGKLQGKYGNAVLHDAAIGTHRRAND
ncbi:MAG TPA: alpha/beta hydrolase [Rhodanobacteraceae bacterium]|nr:alpha/beta hydrolase [Rhodanobacteraceae bacterium]